MKLSHLFFRLFWTILFGLSTKVMYGQFLNTTLADQVSGTSGNSSGIKNTGTDTWIEEPGHNDAQCQSNISMCDNKNRWQVDVFDGPDGKFTWSFKGSGTLLDPSGSGYSKGEKTLASLGYAEKCDPDVALARLKSDGKLWAMVVGISKDGAPGYGRILVTTLYWVPGSSPKFELGKACEEDHFFVGATWPSQLSGHESVSGISLGRTCKSPNIDANSAGRVSIVWHEDEPLQVAVDWGWPFNETQYQIVHRGNAYALNGYINGRDTEEKSCMCKGNCKELMFRSFYDGILMEVVDLFYPSNVGDPIDPSDNRFVFPAEYRDFCGGVPIGVPYEKGLVANVVTYVNPDVCISEPLSVENIEIADMVTYTFYRSGFDPNGYSFGPNGMIVTQDLWTNCYWDNRDRLGPQAGSFYPPQYSDAGTTYFRKENFGNLLLGQSRIAAPGFADESNWKDFTLVQGSNGGYCDSELGDVIRSYVRVWGRRGDEVTDDGVNINLPSNEFEFQNGGPVVSHWSNESQFPNRFFASWSGYFLDNGYRTDVVIKAYELSINGTVGSGGGSGTLDNFLPSGPYPGYNSNYSFSNASTMGEQSIVSISSRHFGILMGTLFWTRVTSGVEDAIQKWACYSSVTASGGLDLACYEDNGGGGQRPAQMQKKGYSKFPSNIENKAMVQPNPSSGVFKV